MRDNDMEVASDLDWFMTTTRLASSRLASPKVLAAHDNHHDDPFGPRPAYSYTTYVTC